MNQQLTRYGTGLQRCLLACSLLAASFALCADDAQPILFGVFPYLPPAHLEQLYAPVAADLSAVVSRRAAAAHPTDPNEAVFAPGTCILGRVVLSSTQ